MATKTKKRNTTTKANLKTQYGKIHDQVLDVTEEALEITVDNIEKWQKLLRKTIKNSSPIVEKNIDLTFEVAETLGKQYKLGSSRIKNLLGLDGKSLKNAIDTNVKSAKRVAKKIETTAIDVIENTTGLDIDGINTKAAKVNTVAKKVVKKTKTATSNLKIITGIGPKIEKLLKAEGINNLTDLASAKLTTLNKVLDTAGPRFQMHDPSTWVTQAKTIIKG